MNFILALLLCSCLLLQYFWMRLTSKRIERITDEVLTIYGHLRWLTERTGERLHELEREK